MYVCYTPPLPGCAEKGVLATLTLAATDDGLITVGHSLTSLTTLEPLSLGCTPPVQQEDLDERVGQVLFELVGALQTLLDWEPFPE